MSPANYCILYGICEILRLFFFTWICRYLSQSISPIYNVISKGYYVNRNLLIVVWECVILFCMGDIWYYSVIRMLCVWGEVWNMCEIVSPEYLYHVMNDFPLLFPQPLMCHKSSQLWCVTSSSNLCPPVSFLYIKKRAFWESIGVKVDQGKNVHVFIPFKDEKSVKLLFMFSGLYSNANIWYPIPFLEEFTLTDFSL